MDSLVPDYMTQTEIAEKTGISKTNVHRWLKETKGMITRKFNSRITMYHIDTLPERIKSQMPKNDISCK